MEAKQGRHSHNPSILSFSLLFVSPTPALVICMHVVHVLYCALVVRSELLYSHHTTQYVVETCVDREGMKRAVGRRRRRKRTEKLISRKTGREREKRHSYTSQFPTYPYCASPRLSVSPCICMYGTVHVHPSGT